MIAAAARAPTRRLAWAVVPLAASLVTAAALWRVVGLHDRLSVGLMSYGVFFIGSSGLVRLGSRPAPHTAPLVDQVAPRTGRGAPTRTARQDPREGGSARAAAERPLRHRTFTGDDAVLAATCLLSALAAATTARALLGWGGILSTALWTYAGFLLLFFVLVSDRVSKETALDRTVTVMVWSSAGVVVALLAWMIGFLVVKGLPGLRPGFFTEDLSKVGPLTPGGGAEHAIIGTLEQVGIATVVVVPIAVLTAVYLHELEGRMAGVIRFIVDAMSGLPSIVAGLLVFTVWVNGRGFSGIAGAAALAVLMIPPVTRTSEEILRTIPQTLREASLALGAPQWRVTLRVVLPTALTGLVTAVILGIARAVGETAPVLLTAFGSDATNVDAFKGPQADLPLFVWKLIRLPNETQVQRAWTGALILVALVLVLFATARVVTSRGQRRLGRAR